MSEPSPSREFALEIVCRLRQAGYSALWAGGCVRDLILGEIPADYDVATSATPEEVMAALPYKAITVGLSFGVVRVHDHHRAGGNVEVEVATFRSDGAYVDGRRPQSVVFGSPELDAARRDFTINGMFMDPVSGEVIDHVGGQADLTHHILRAIGDPVARLREDKLRCLRAIRLAARFRLDIEPATHAALRAMARQVKNVSAERIAQELRKMLMHSTRVRAMNLALETGLVAVVLPPLLPMKGLFQGKPAQPEGDLWDHTMLVLDLLPSEPSFTLAFAALLHDSGKPATRALQRGRYSFHQHEQAGARIAERLCRELKLSNTEREQIIWLVSHHQYLGAARSLRESKLKRILSEPGIQELLALHEADALASFGNSEEVDYCRRYLESQPTGPINPAPLLNGHDLVRHGLEPGPRFAALLEQLRDAQLEGAIHNKREALEWVERRLADSDQASPGTTTDPDAAQKG
jgi:poly(A) polymerase